MLSLWRHPEVLYKAFALSLKACSIRVKQGALQIASVPRVLPWAKSFWAFSPFLNHLRTT